MSNTIENMIDNKAAVYELEMLGAQVAQVVGADKTVPSAEELALEAATREYEARLIRKYLVTKSMADEKK